MKTRSLAAFLLILSLSILQMGMARNAQYDEEARAAEREAKRLKKLQKQSGSNQPVRGIASGVREAAVDSTTGLISDTVQGTGENPPIIDNIEGARLGSGKAVDTAVKGAFKVATLGFGDVDTVKVEEPKKNTDETTKFSISIPGT